MEALDAYLVRLFINTEFVHSASPNAPVRPDPPRRRTLSRLLRR
jgi:hypothetical protein